MNRLSLPNLLVAILLVLIIPLEQGRCMCGSLAPHAHAAMATAATASADCHDSCCDSPSAAHGEHHGQPSKAPQGCACASYSAGVLPVVPSVSASDVSIAAFVLLPSLCSVEPVSEPREHPPALDVGSPPLPDVTGAHGLRAPPVSA